MIDKKSIAIGTLIGTLLGIIISVFFISIIIYTISGSFKIENINVTVTINQTRLENMIKESPGYKKLYLETSYKNDVIPTTYYQDNILFAGATFQYNNEYIIQAWDISPDQADIRIIQNGNIAFNGTCYKNQMCNIRNISFQIDDIHIGKEASYIVYWSNG